MSDLSSKSHYEILGVQNTATAAQIKLAYREKLLSTHPDKTNKHEATEYSVVELKTAYATLSDDTLRRDYDEQLQQNFKKSGLISTGDGLDEISLDDFDCVGSEDEVLFKKDCPRCTTQEGFVLNEHDLEHNGTPDGMGGYEIIVQCSDCSLWLKVQYYEDEE